jgi:hypothetical protein
VSLDWGFDGPLRFAERELSTIEPIWAMRRAHRPGRAWRFAGTSRHVYLLFEEDFAVFEFGPKLLAALEGLDPDRVAIRRHLDRAGDPAFVSVRFSGPHRLRYARDFEVELE